MTHPTKEDSMNDTIIHIDAAAPLKVLDEHGWTQGAYGSGDGPVCLHGAIRLCAPEPGDAHLIEQVANRHGWGTGWNDADGRTEAEVRARLAVGIDVTDTDLTDTFGPEWRMVVALVRKAATLTDAEVRQVTDAEVRQVIDAEVRQVIDAEVRQVAAVWNAARDAVWSAASDAVWGAVSDAARNAVWSAAWSAARSAVTWDLATPDGPYTIAHRDLLIGPWLTIQPDLVDLAVES
jgi:hypothetical protein